jgi:hypothetical protein
VNEPFGGPVEWLDHYHKISLWTPAGHSPIGTSTADTDCSNGEYPTFVGARGTTDGPRMARIFIQMHDARATSLTNARTMPKKPREIVEFIKEHGVKMVDLRFTDVPGTWQHTTVPADQMDEGAFEEGIGFDGSSIRGFQSIHESDMLLIPDLDTAVIDPFLTIPTISFVCDVFDPVLKALYAKDPRNIAKRAEAHLLKSGIGDQAFFGPEA